MNYLRILSELGILVSLLYYAAATLAALRFAERASGRLPALPKVAPRVAVLKPLNGLSANLVDNLISYLEVSYPRIEFLFGVASYEDRAADAVVALRARYQFANLTLVVGEEPGCANRKVAKLIAMADRVPRAEILVVSDADVSVPREHLRLVVGELAADERVGVVTCAYRALAAGTLASRLEALFVNTDFAPQVILAAAIEPMRYALGATMAIKRAALDAIGGFRALKDYLADDFYLGRLVARHGWRVKLSTSLVTVNCEEQSLPDFWRHQLRWARTFRTARRLSIATILTHGPLWALIFFAISGASPFAVRAMIAVIAARIAMVVLMMRWVLELPVTAADLWWLIPKDFIMSGIWLVSLLGRRVTWAGRRFRIMRGGVIREIGGGAAGA
jgi:ceramide glucosyltransferase